MVLAQMTKSELAEVVGFIGKKFDAQKREFNQLGVRFERMQADIRQIAEALAGTNERLERVEKRLGDVESKLGDVEVRVMSLETRVGQQTILIENLDVRFDRFESGFRANRLDVQRRLKALEN